MKSNGVELKYLEFDNYETSQILFTKVKYCIENILVKIIVYKSNKIYTEVKDTDSNNKILVKEKDIISNEVLEDTLDEIIKILIDRECVVDRECDDLKTNKAFLDWVLESRERLLDRGIFTDSIKFEDKIRNVGTCVNYSTEEYMASVVVWACGMMEFQIFSIESAELLKYEYFDNIINYNFNQCLEGFFNILV